MWGSPYKGVVLGSKKYFQKEILVLPFGSKVKCIEIGCSKQGWERGERPKGEGSLKRDRERFVSNGNASN